MINDCDLWLANGKRIAMPIDVTPIRLTLKRKIAAMLNQQNIDWTKANSAQANAEGWDIFAVDSDGHPPFELQACFDAGIFMDGTSADDAAAVAHVVGLAEQGSPLHCHALRFIATHAADEAHHWIDQGLWPLSFAPEQGA